MFEVKGKFKQGLSWQGFTKKVDVKDEDEARERIFCLFGGNHGIPRQLIKIESMEKA